MSSEKSTETPPELVEKQVSEKKPCALTGLISEIKAIRMLEHGQFAAQAMYQAALKYERDMSTCESPKPKRKSG